MVCTVILLHGAWSAQSFQNRNKLVKENVHKVFIAMSRSDPSGGMRTVTH